MAITVSPWQIRKYSPLAFHIPPRSTYRVTSEDDVLTSKVSTVGIGSLVIGEATAKSAIDLVSSSSDSERGFLFGGSHEDEDDHLKKTPRKRVVPLATAKMLKRPLERLRLLRRQLSLEEEDEADDTEMPNLNPPVVIDLVSSESDQDRNPQDLNEEEREDAELWDVIRFSIVGPPSAPVPQPKGTPTNCKAKLTGKFRKWGRKPSDATTGPKLERVLERGFPLRSLQSYEGGSFADTSQFNSTKNGLVRRCHGECLYQLRGDNVIRYIKNFNLKVPYGARCWVRLVYAYDDRVLRREIEAKFSKARNTRRDAAEKPVFEREIVRPPKRLHHDSLTYAVPDYNRTGVYNPHGTTKEQFTGEDDGEVLWISKPGLSCADMNERTKKQIICANSLLRVKVDVYSMWVRRARP